MAVFLPYFFVFLVVLSGSGVQAMGKGSFACIPSLRETHLSIIELSDRIEFVVTNPSGYEFMPQFEGPASAYSLSFLKMQSDDLKSLGQQFKFSWPKDKCELDAQRFVLNCQGPAQSDYNQVQAFGISTTEISEKSNNGSYMKRKYRVTLEKENTYFLTLVYFTEHCFGSAEKRLAQIGRYLPRSH